MASFHEWTKKLKKVKISKINLPYSSFLSQGTNKVLSNVTAHQAFYSQWPSNHYVLIGIIPHFEISEVRNILTCPWK